MFAGAGMDEGPGNLHPDQFTHVILHEPPKSFGQQVGDLAQKAKGGAPSAEEIAHQAQNVMFAGHQIAQPQLRNATVQRTVNA